MGLHKLSLLVITIGVVLAGCGGDPEITQDMLDGEVIFDPSLYDPESYLISYSIPEPTVEQAKMPVMIVAHGYSASTFEWDEFRDWNDNNSDILISQVLLDGHGRTYDDFKNATWQDWENAIKKEYDRLVQAGFTNIHFAGSSTGSTLILHLVSSGYFDAKIIPGHIFLIDPIVIPSNKSLSLIGLVGPMLGYIESDNSTDEDKYWYHFRPQETLQELMRLLKIIRKDLEKGIKLPEGCSLKVYKSEKDPTADPVSAVLISMGVKNHDNEGIEVDIIDSELHVYTRLSLRNQVTQKDIKNQLDTFEDMAFQINN